MKRGLFFISSILLIQGCDSPTGSRVTSLSISPESASVLVGDSVLFRVHSNKGEDITSSVSWASDNTAVLTVNKGIAKATSPGNARVIASKGGINIAAEVRVSSQAAMNPDSTCITGSTVSLEEGEVYLGSTIAATALECIRAESTDEEFILIPINSATSGTLTFTTTISGIVPITPQSTLSPSRNALNGSHTEESESFHVKLRRQEKALWRGKLNNSRISSSFNINPDMAEVGQTLRFNVQAEQPCTLPIYREGKVVAISNKAIIVADTTNPSGGFTEVDYRRIAETFDSIIYPTNVANFGTPSDIDGNQRTVIFYTSAVNQLTPRNSTSYVGGFFFARDLFPPQSTSAVQGCAGSNNAEIFYMLVPDPEGTVNGNSRTKAFVEASTLGTLAHEFQHLINASRRLYITNAEDFEEVWLNEGLSHIAEELVFFRQSGLSPGTNISFQTVTSSEQVRSAFNLYVSANFGRLGRYLQSPSSNSPYQNDDDLETRGAIWQFLRYIADSKAGDDTSLWFSLTNSSYTGLQNLQNALGDSIQPLLQAWSIASYTDDTSKVHVRYTHPSWNYRSMFSSFSSYNTYPLSTIQAQNNASVVSTLVKGGTAYIRFRVPTHQVASVRIGGLTASSNLKYAVVRTR